MRIDLHLHTSCSDGLLPPARVVQAARRAGLDVIAITDHDTLAGVAPAQAAAAADGGPRVVPGIELTCTRNGADLHLLGYAVDPAHPGLAGLAAGMIERRRGRALAIVAKLRALGVAIHADDVRSEVPAGNAAIGRPHIAQALVRLGRVGSIQEAFSRWLADGGPAYIPSGGPPVAEGIRAVLAAGGCPVWAHPSNSDARHFAALREEGLAGIEALRPQQPPAECAALEQAARAAGLVVTGGSDWHGSPRQALGTWFVTDNHIAPFLRRVGILAV